MAAEISEIFYYQLQPLKSLLPQRGNLPPLQGGCKLSTAFSMEPHSKRSAGQTQQREEAEKVLTEH